MKQKKSEPLDKELKYVTFPVVMARITDSVEAEIWENGKRQIMGDAKSQKPNDDRRNTRCALHGLNSNNIAQIQWITCPHCRACWMHHVTGKGKRRAPAAPPGLEHIEPIEDVYDADRAIGTLIKLVNSGRADSQNLANCGDVAQRPFSALPFYSCIDATHP